MASSTERIVIQARLVLTIIAHDLQYVGEHQILDGNSGSSGG
jgi:hypothetical protein